MNIGKFSSYHSKLWIRCIFPRLVLGDINPKYFALSTSSNLSESRDKENLSGDCRDCSYELLPMHAIITTLGFWLSIERLLFEYHLMTKLLYVYFLFVCFISVTLSTDTCMITSAAKIFRTRDSKVKLEIPLMNSKTRWTLTLWHIILMRVSRYMYSNVSCRNEMICWPLLNQVCSTSWMASTGTPFTIYEHGLTLIPAWISNHMPSNAWDKITYPISKLQRCNRWSLEWICYFIPYFIMGAITSPCRG